MMLWRGLFYGLLFTFLFILSAVVTIIFPPLILLELGLVLGILLHRWYKR